MTDHINELEEAVAEAKAKAAHREYPKYVEPHASHVVIKEAIGAGTGHVSVPGFTEHFVDRESRVMVMVHSAEEEAKAIAVKELV